VTQNPPGTPPVLITPADVTGPGTTPPGSGGSTLTFDGSLTLEIGGQKYTLTGTLGDHIIVEYHAAFDDSISLGPITGPSGIASQVATTFGFPGFDTEITKALGDLNTVPLVGAAVDAVLTASVRITDLEINTLTGSYGIGVALDFSTSNPSPSLFGVALVALGFKVTRVKTAATPQP
jgi:hypothetical protein